MKPSDLIVAPFSDNYKLIFELILKSRSLSELILKVSLQHGTDISRLILDPDNAVSLLDLCIDRHNSIESTLFKKLVDSKLFHQIDQTKARDILMFYNRHYTHVGKEQHKKFQQFVKPIAKKLALTSVVCQ